MAAPPQAAAECMESSSPAGGVFGFNMIWLTDRVDLHTAEIDEMLDGGGLLARPPPVGAVFPFSQLPDALELLNSGTSVGKVVVEVGDDIEAPP